MLRYSILNTRLGTLAPHKYQHYLVPRDTSVEAKKMSFPTFGYLLKVYVDDYMILFIPMSAEQLRHVASAVMHGIHDVSPRMMMNMTLSP